MHVGATLGRRFTVLRAVDYDLPGVDRFVAHDSRRDIDVTLDVVTSLAPTAVRKAAVRAAQVRDARFARVLASGRETVGDDRVTYIVTERPTGVRLEDVAGARIVPPKLAASIVGEAARALHEAAGLGVHHGYLRAAALTVTPAGRVVVAGLAADGELATQAGYGRGSTQEADALALARLYLTLVTGRDADEATVGDVPEDPPLAAGNLARATLAGDGPTTLAQVIAAMGAADSRALRRLRGTLSQLEQTPQAQQEPAHTSAVAIEPATLDTAAHDAAAALAAGLVEPAAADAILHDHLEVVELPAEEPAAPTEAEKRPKKSVPPEVAAQFSKRTRRIAASQAGKPEPLDRFDQIAARQNSKPSRSVVQAALEGLEKRWPESTGLAAASARARHRAQRQGPINSGPLLVGVFITITLVVAFMAFATLRAPFEPDYERTNTPAQYPEFTFGPEPSPSPSGGGSGDE